LVIGSGGWDWFGGFVVGDLAAAPVIDPGEELVAGGEEIVGGHALLSHQTGFGIGVGFQGGVGENVADVLSTGSIRISTSAGCSRW
jgi:hypothetical protein